MYSVAFETGERAKTGKIFFLLGLILLVFLFLPHYSFALAVPYSSITEDTVWSVENSPYVLTKTLTIQNTATLTIDEGVIVKFKGTTIQVKGGLVVNGSNENHVVFSSYWDDSAGGDTNGDGGLSKPSSLDYWQVYFFDSLKPRHLRYIDARYSSQPFYLNQTVATSTLSDVTISHVGSGIGTAFANIEARNLIISDAMRHALWLNGGVIDIENGDFSAADFYREGVSINYGANVRLHNIKVRELQYGPAVKVTNSNVSISSSTFSGNPGVGISVSGNTNVRVSSSVIENNASSAVYASGGNLVMEDSVIRGNRRGIDIVTGSGGAPSIFARNSVIVNNELGGVRNGGASGSAVDVRENYWGDASGPYHATENPGGLGNLIQGEALFTPWLSEDPTPEKTELEPVLIIPGIGGSELYNGDELIWLNLGKMFDDVGDQFITENLALDDDGRSIVTSIIAKDIIDDILGTVGGINFKIADIFKGLMSQLEVEGYVRNKSIYLFPYDWRLNLENTADLLSEKINAIKTVTGASKVNVIAHSMGGLLAKSYFSEYGYGDVNKLIFVGTPHLGSPKAARIIVSGDQMEIPWLDSDRIKELGRRSPAVYELLPNNGYFSEQGGYVKPYKFFGVSNYYNLAETKEYLTSKGASQNIFELADHFQNQLGLFSPLFVDTYNITGCKVNTQSAYSLGVGGNVGKIGYSSGDGTVPLLSGGGINLGEDHQFYAKNASHLSLPSSEYVRDAIVNILLNRPVASSDKFGNDRTFCNFKGKTLTWRSPVAVHIYDEEGKHTGPIENGLERGIPNVGYDIIDGETFIYLPTDEGQNYRIEGTGTDTGTFDLLISENENGENITTSMFNDVAVDTNTNIKFSISDQSSDDTIVVEKGLESKEIVRNSVLAGQLGDDIVPPETEPHVIGDEGNGGWYRSDVHVSLSAMDDLSGVLISNYSLDGGITFNTYTEGIVISTEGETELKFYSVDKAGNNEAIKSVMIKIDKTYPQFVTYFDIATKGYVFKGVNGEDAVCDFRSCMIVDQAGNKSILEYLFENTGAVYKLIFTSLQFGEIKKSVEVNKFTVTFDEKDGIIKKYIQDWQVDKKEVLKIEYSPPRDESSVYSGGVKSVLAGKRTLQIYIKSLSTEYAIK